MVQSRLRRLAQRTLCLRDRFQNRRREPALARRAGERLDTGLLTGGAAAARGKYQREYRGPVIAHD